LLSQLDRQVEQAHRVREVMADLLDKVEAVSGFAPMEMKTRLATMHDAVSEMKAGLDELATSAFEIMGEQDG